MKIVDVEDLYSEDKELKKEHVKQLIEWNEKQAHLPKFSGKLSFLLKKNYSSKVFLMFNHSSTFSNHLSI